MSSLFRSDPPPYPEPPAGVRYPQLLRNPGATWWRAVAGILLALWAWLLLGSLVSQVVLAAAWQWGHNEMPKQDFYDAARRYEFWEGMLASHLSIITMIPIVFTVLRFVHGVPIGRIWSVADRIRWRYLAACFGIAIVVFAGYVATMPLQGQPLTWRPQPGLLPFVVLIFLLTPFQSMAEEMMFRGYLTESIGSLVSNPWPGVIGSSLLFAFFHGSQNPQLFISRFAFGMVVGWLVVRTGGLEAGIAAHITNNVFSFLLAGLTGSIAGVRQVTEVGWLKSFSDVITFAVIAVLAAVLARWMKVPDRTAETVGETRVTTA